MRGVGDWTSVGPVGDRPALAAVVLRGREIALARLEDGSWAAFDNSCTHEDCPLADGDLDGERVICYCHGSEFDLRTGEVLVGPAEERLSIYPVRIENGDLQVAVP